MKRQIIFFLSITLLLLTTAGCIENPEFKRIENFKIEKINKEAVYFNADVEIYNPNNKKIKIKKSNFKLYVNDHYIGNAKLLQSYKMGKNTTTLNNVPIEVLLEKDVYLSLIQMAIGKSVEIRLEGNLKGSVSGFPYSKKINETKNVNLKDLGLNLGSFLGF